MKIEDIFPPEGKNTKRAKAIRAKLKTLAKKANPGENVEGSGWNFNQFQGSFNKMRMTR